MSTSTPWGASQIETVIAPGITRYVTASHGGVCVSHSRIESLPAIPAAALRAFGMKDVDGPESGLWFEEGISWAVPAVVFEADYRLWALRSCGEPDPGAAAKYADGLMRAAHERFLDVAPEQYQAVTGIVATPENSSALADAQFKRQYADGWMVYKWGDREEGRGIVVLDLVRVAQYFSASPSQFDILKIEMPLKDWDARCAKVLASKLSRIAVDPREYKLVDRQDFAYVLHGDQAPAGSVLKWAQLWRDGDSISFTLHRYALGDGGGLDDVREAFARATNLGVDAVLQEPVPGSEGLIRLTVMQPLGDIAEVKREMAAWLAGAWGSNEIHVAEMGRPEPLNQMTKPRCAA